MSPLRRWASRVLVLGLLGLALLGMVSPVWALGLMKDAGWLLVAAAICVLFGLALEWWDDSFAPAVAAELHTPRPEGLAPPPAEQVRTSTQPEPVTARVRPGERPWLSRWRPVFRPRRWGGE